MLELAILRYVKKTGSFKLEPKMILDIRALIRIYFKVEYFFSNFRSSISEPPQFSKKESRFEREQRAKPVGSVSGYTPGAPNAVREE